MVVKRYTMTFLYDKTETHESVKFLNYLKDENCTGHCTLLLLTNLASLLWKEVSCNNSLLSNILCEVSRPSNNQTQTVPWVVANYFCPEEFFIKNETCYIFTWVRVWRPVTNAMTVKKWTQEISEDLQKFEFIFFAMATVLPPIFGQHFNIYILVHVYFNIFKYNKYKVENSTEGLHLISQNLEKVSPKQAHMFRCDNGRHILSIFVCNDENDCAEKSSHDEMFCVCSNLAHMQNACKYVQTNHSVAECSPLHMKSSINDCLPYVFGKQIFAKPDKPNLGYFQCNDKTSISHDLVYDCFPFEEDEPTLFNMKKYHMKDACFHKNQMPCRAGYSQCYNVTDLCRYVLNTLGNITPCRKGEHISECKDFHCNTMFKCPNYYCIMWNYICDGKWDCPFGRDELSMQSCLVFKICVNMYKCKDSNLCIHLGQTCNNNPDCPRGDDELFCSIKDVTCPLGCTCLMSAAACFSVTITFETLNQILHFKSAWIQLSNFSWIQTEIVSFANSQTEILQIQQKNLVDLSHFICNRHNLVTVDASFNKIERISSNCFSEMTRIVFILLSHNSLTHIMSQHFKNLDSLQLVNFSHNPVINIQEKPFENVSNLFYVSFYRTDDVAVCTIFVHNQFLNDLPVKVLQTNDYHICCLLPEKARCTASLPWYLSCGQLLKNVALQSNFYCVSILTLLANFLSVLLQIVTYKKRIQKKAAYGIVVASINLSDAFCSFPMFVTWIADLHFAKNFITMEIQWRSSFVCFLTFAVFLFFTLLSPAVLCLLSYQRLELVKNPIDTEWKHAKFVMRKAALVYGVCLLITTLFSGFIWLNTFLVNSHIPTPFCSPFIDPAGKLIAVPILASLASLWYLFCIIFIIVIYYNLVASVNESKKSVKDAASKEHSNTPLIVQVVVVTLSNILCWSPCSAVYISVMFLKQYPIELIVWTNVAVVPINSIINPLIFVVVSFRKIFGEGN